MPCKTQGYQFDVCLDFGGANSEHCYYYTPPSGGATLSYIEYPIAMIRDGNNNYNLPDRRDNHIMYPFTSVTYSDSEGPPAGVCGKEQLTDPCPPLVFSRDNYTSTAIYLDYTPNELSFDFGYSDTWFAYLYDTSDEAGHVGTACYYIETQQTTTATTVTPGAESETEPSEGSADQPNIRCIPCAAFTCSPESTTLRYTAGQDLTGDADCPHPTLFGFGTNSNKLAFTYDQFSTQTPNGVIDFEVSYDGVTYVDAWDGTTGITYESSQNPWQSGEDNFVDFEIYDINDGVNAVDLRLKFRIEPIYDASVDPTVFSGTKWTCTEILSNGTGFSVNDVFDISYEHRHPDNSITTFTLYIRISAVGNIASQQVVEGADILRVNDTLNGHTITRAFHTEIGKFPYHIVYLDGNGDDFVKDTQYTSSRDHVITAVAGYGITDRAILVGLYEFLDKSVQFLTGDVNRNASDVFNDIELPRAFIKFNENGSITDINLSSGAYRLDFKDFYDLNNENDLSGYTGGTNIATSGGSGSGLTVDISLGQVFDDEGNTLSDVIEDITINTAGSNYAAGDIVTISGGTARVRIGEVTSGGSNLNLMKQEPELGITAPNDNNTGLSNKSTDDGEAKFELEVSTDRLKFEIVSTKEGLPNVEAIDAKNGGDNVLAELIPVITGGVLTSVNIVNPGRGYNISSRAELVINNFSEDTTEVFGNDAFRDDLVGEFQGIVKSLPDGQINASAEDLQAIEDSYNQVPTERTAKNLEPVIDIKLDRDRERVNQRPQQKLTADQTEPLRSLIVPNHEVSYLGSVDIPSDYKQVFVDDLQRSKDTVNNNIDSITQEKYPDYRVGDESKVETVQGSFTNLPVASKFTKYIIRQYRPDSKKKATINVTLSCTPVDIGCEHFSCPPPVATIGGTTSTSETDPLTGDTTDTSTTTTYTMSGLLGPGCQAWEASGTITIWHDVTRAARTVVAAAQAYGNPFAD